jgi:MoxR-like ATPase
MADNASNLELLKDLTPLDWNEMTRPEHYVPWDKDLIAATNVALALGKPLLLTGDPGVGKSEFSRWLAHELCLGDREKFVVKSTTEATDLFYTYDTLGRFHDAQINTTNQKPTLNSNSTETTDNRSLRYLKFQALGTAILNSLGRDFALREGFCDDIQSINISATPRRTVVLIDEIDKAPRDVPNDILEEIDKMTFSVKEIGSRPLQSDKMLRPIVVITSNSERDLPEPFLRRCIYYHIPFPEHEEDLTRILLSRLHTRSPGLNPQLLADALKMLHFLRSDLISFMRKPGLAELLDWLYELTREPKLRAISLNEMELNYSFITAKSTLLKHAEDQKKATLENWLVWMTQAGLQHANHSG